MAEEYKERVLAIRDGVAWPSSRTRALKQLTRLVATADGKGVALPEPVVRVVCRILAATAAVAVRRQNRLLLETAARALLAPGAAAGSGGHLLAALQAESKRFRVKDSNPDPAPAPTALTGVRLLALVLRGSLATLDDAALQQAAGALATYTRVTALPAAKEQLRLSVAHALANALRSLQPEEAAKQLGRLVAAVLKAGPALPWAEVVLLSQLVALAQGRGVDLAAHKEAILKAYTTAVLGAKACPPSDVLHASKALLALATHEDVASVLMPSVQRLMKRNADAVLPGLPTMFAGLALDLGRYTDEVVESLGPSFQSSSGAQRQHVVNVFAAVAGKSSAADPVKRAVQSLVQMLTDKKAKLTKWEQRQSVLAAIRGLSQAKLSASGRNDVAALATDQVLAYCAKEAHEETKVMALATLEAFLDRARAVPDALPAHFKAYLGDGKMKAAERAGHARCMAQCYAGDAVAFLPAMLSAIGRAEQQKNATAAEEAAFLARIAMDVRVHDPNQAAELEEAGFFKALTGPHLFSDKFFASVSDDAALAYCTAVFLALNNCMETVAKLGDLVSTFDHIVGLALLPAWQPRKHTLTALRAFLGSYGTVSAVQHLATAFGRHLAEAEKQQEGDEPTSPRLFEGVLLAMAVPSPSSVKSEVALELLDGSSAALFSTRKTPLFHAVMSRLELSFEALFQEQEESLFARLVAAFDVLAQADDDQTGGLAGRSLGMLTSCDGCEGLVDKLVSESIRRWQAPELPDVTAQDVAVLLCPEGVVLKEHEKAAEGDAGPRLDPNSKDYEDRLWEAQVKRDLARKKPAGGAGRAAAAAAGGGRKGGKKGSGKGPSKQEQEQRAAQLAKEAAVRARVGALQQSVSGAAQMLDGMIQSAPQRMAPHVHRVGSEVLRHMGSPLVAADAVRVWVGLRACARGLPVHLRDALSHAVLRLREPACGVSPAWRAEALPGLVARVTRAVWARTNASGALDAPTFAYCFPLLEHVLVRSGREPPAVMEDAMVAASVHAALGRSALVDRAAVLALLRHVVEHHSRLAHQAAVMLVDFCAFVGAAPAASRAGPAELAELLAGLYSASGDLRLACVRGLKHLPAPAGADGGDPAAVCRLWVACFDPVEENKALASGLWEERGLLLPAAFGAALLSALEAPHAEVREAGAAAYGAGAKVHPDAGAANCRALVARYKALLVVPEPRRDQLGNIVSDPFVDPWPARAGVLGAVAAMAGAVPDGLVVELFQFFVRVAFADRSAEARAAARAACLAAIDAKGRAHVGQVYGIFEGFLTGAAAGSARQDVVRESVIIALGSLAKHLDKADPKIPSIVETLLATLATPSQQVQEAVSKCLSPLVAANKGAGPAHVARLLGTLLEGGGYGERRGAAYGLAGVVKGLGISALKQEGVMPRCLEAIQDRKAPKHREGALMAFELLCLAFGRLFEPYVIHVLPHLLACYGDGNKDVREAAADTARAIMSKLSGHGVKLVLPSLLTALADDAWRTKQGSAQLLGQMAFCAPKQLSSCLPQIVPQLCETITDSHAKVQQAGREALQRIASVIKNPEIQAIVDTILAALYQPTEQTQRCLTTLLETAFVHIIDAPSLATIMPVLQRAIRDRATENKKKAAQIIGNMYSLTAPKDLAPYLPSVVPGLKEALIDPVPEVRGVAAKAIGTMVKGMGEATFPGMVGWLLETLRSEESVVDRSGGAQGLSEVLSALGDERLGAMLPGFLAATEDPLPHIREGHFMLLVFLPLAFGPAFKPFVGPVIPAVLRGLADMEETVRDKAMRAGQRIVNNFSESSIEFLLPQLEVGLMDEGWRIRQSSLQLLGDLMYCVSGLSGNKSTEGDEDDGYGTEEARLALVAAFGRETLHRVLAGLYMARQDVSVHVRQVAVHVWKVVISHTVRTLREILPVLVDLLLSCLASAQRDRRDVAARTLGELVRKLGERVLPEVFPILERGLSAERGETRMGVCVGLSEIMRSTGTDQVAEYEASLVPNVRRALCDPLPQVREAAAETFATLHNALQGRAIDGILPALLGMLQGDPEQAANALDGLGHIMRAKSKVVLPFLVPRLTAPPMSAFNARALASLAAVAGPALNRHLPVILTAMVESICGDGGAGGVGAAAVAPEDRASIEKAACDLVLAIDEEGAPGMVDDLVVTLGTDQPAARRRTGAVLLREFCGGAAVDLEPFIQPLVRALLLAFTDPDPDLLHAVYGALSAVTRAIRDDKADHLRHICKCVEYASMETGGGEIPGFCIPDGLTPILELYRECLTQGATADVKQRAAEGLGALIRLTSPEALKPLISKLAGPLIRMFSEPTASLRAAILGTLCTLLEKCGPMVKSFVSQLQLTCKKAIRDPGREVRVRAGKALSFLLPLQRERRVDDALKELRDIATSEAGEPQVTALRSLRACLVRAAPNASAAGRQATLDTLLALYQREDGGGGGDDEELREAAGAALGSLAPALDDAGLGALLDSLLKGGGGAKGGEQWHQQHGAACALEHLLLCDGERALALGPGRAAALTQRLVQFTSSDNVHVASAGCRATAFLIRRLVPGAGGAGGGGEGEGQKSLDALVVEVDRLRKQASEDEVLAALGRALEAAALKLERSLPYLALVTPRLVTLAAQRSGQAKMASEQALIMGLDLVREEGRVLEEAMALMAAKDAAEARSFYDRVLVKRVAKFDPRRVATDAYGL